MQSLMKHVRTFHGEGTSEFNTWLQDMDQMASTCDSERMCVLATLTHGGTAGTFVARVLRENPAIHWQELRSKLKERFSDECDPFLAQEKCRRLHQHKGESIHNFAERLRNAATDAYDNLTNPDTQRTLVEIFQKGVTDDRLARNLIRKRFEKLDNAVGYASGEQREDRTFEMCRHR